MTREEVTEAYGDYIACLNRQDWGSLDRHVADQVRHNDRTIGLTGYRTMLMEDFRAIPDLFFRITRLVCDPPMIACVLSFDCTPTGEVFGLPVNGARVQFDEHVFYEFTGRKILNVWSVIDKAAIAAQLPDA